MESMDFSTYFSPRHKADVVMGSSCIMGAIYDAHTIVLNQNDMPFEEFKMLCAMRQSFLRVATKIDPNGVMRILRKDPEICGEHPDFKIHLTKDGIVRVGISTPEVA